MCSHGGCGGYVAPRLADARPRFGKEHVGLIAVRARCEAGGRRLSIGALTRPLLCPLPSQTAEAIRHFLVIQGNGARLSTGRLLLPFRQLGEQPALCPFGCSDALRDELCPRPAQAERSEEHTSELQSIMRIPYAVFCLKK